MQLRLSSGMFACLFSSTTESMKCSLMSLRFPVFYEYGMAFTYGNMRVFRSMHCLYGSEVSASEGCVCYTGTYLVEGMERVCLSSWSSKAAGVLTLLSTDISNLWAFVGWMLCLWRIRLDKTGRCLEWRICLLLEVAATLSGLLLLLLFAT
ncbi:hypothetical protein EJ06DRAFT_365815 [Trichodelitschia bisporula]|uniref:Uncharacterized protein n=1 Tax=Trichodelitschia bisporula TaxID=703511 RepID=A0A6G1I105_9PEZI|nr:hypothetical protein EJ06DRAFT_365815 [Trichodelitschia bisporula]